MDDQTFAWESAGTTDEGRIGYKGKAVFESNVRSHQDLSTCNILNTEISADSQNCASSGTNSYTDINNMSATDLQLISVTENTENSRSPISDYANEPEQYSTTQQSDEYNDFLTIKTSQKNTTFIVGNAERDVDVTKKNEAENNCVSSTLSSLSNRLSFWTKKNNLDMLAHTSTSVHASNGETCSLLNPNGEEEASYPGSSLQYMQRQTTEDSFAVGGDCVEKSKHSFPDVNEETSPSHTNNDFQPIILDVRGGYCEMETEDGVQSQSSADLEASDMENISKSKADQSLNTLKFAEDNSFSKSAFQLLQGMAQYAVSSSKMTSKDKISNITNAVSCAETLHSTSLVSEANANCTVRSDNSQVKNLHASTSCALNTYTTLSSGRSTQPISVKCPRSLTATSKTLPSAVLTSSTNNEPQTTRHPKVLSNVLLSNTKGTTYSCVFVQDKNNFKQGQVALLIPQTSLPGLGKACSIAPSDLSTAPVTVSGDNSINSIHNGQTCSPPTLQEHIPNSSMSVMESITKLVTNTVNSFCVQGKDLKDSSLLKVTPPKESECSQYAVSCSVCGEGYYDVHGLKFHRERTVFHLTYHCSVCKRNIVFFNKCSLWAHLKSETEKPVLNYFHILCLKPYEFDKDDGSESHQPETGDADSSSEVSVEPSSITNVSKDGNLPFITAPVEVNTTKSVVQCTVSHLLTPSGGNSQFCSLLKCSVCLRKFPNLISHLCPTMPRKHLCPSCGMFLPSICAQEAHMKIHTGVVKDISCPECGKNDFDTIQEVEDLRCVFDHIDSCKHFNRVLHLKCFCNQEVPNVNHLLKHFTDKHCRTLFKCPLCVLAFTQNGHLVGHLDKIHKMKDTSIKASVLCLFCQQIIKSAGELKEHVDQHVEQFKDNSVFKWKCFICFKSYADKSDLNNHLEEDHPHKSKRCTICYSLFWSRKNLVEHIVQKKCLRFLAQKLNCCVDHQLEVSEQNVDFNKLFKTLNFGSSCHEERQVRPLASKKQLVNIAPKPVSEQSDANKHSNQANQNCLQKIHPTEALTQHNQTLPVVSVSSNSFTNSAPTQPCKIIITGKSNSTEPGKQIQISVSQCVVCRKLIDSKKLQDHLHSHQSQGIIICSICQRRDFTTMEDALKHSSTCLNKSFEAEKCQENSEPHSSGAAEVASNINKEGRQEDAENNEQTQADNDRINIDNQSVFPCLLCGLAFQSLSSREDHVSRLHDGTRMIYHCGICRKRGKSSTFTKKELASRHITKKHRIVNMDSVNRLIRTEEQNVSNGQKLPVSESVPEEADNVSPPKRLRVAGEGDYMCGKCGFSCCNSEEFSQHITAHNSAQEPQCPECGLCFTILHALKKHLLAVHKIKDVDNYLKMKNITEPEMEEEEMEIVPDICQFSKLRPESRDNNSKSNTKTSPHNPLECTVCYKVFDIEANLKTHMRNHGMAFIRSKRHKQ